MFFLTTSSFYFFLTLILSLYLTCVYLPRLGSNMKKILFIGSNLLIIYFLQLYTYLIPCFAFLCLLLVFKTRNLQKQTKYLGLLITISILVIYSLFIGLFIFTQYNGYFTKPEFTRINCTSANYYFVKNYSPKTNIFTFNEYISTEDEYNKGNPGQPLATIIKKDYNRVIVALYSEPENILSKYSINTMVNSSAEEKDKFLQNSTNLLRGRNEQYSNLVKCSQEKSLNFLYQQTQETGPEKDETGGYIVPTTTSINTCYLKKVTNSATDYPDCSAEIKAGFGLG